MWMEWREAGVLEPEARKSTREPKEEEVSDKGQRWWPTGYWGGESGLMSGLKLSICRSLPRVREALENDLVFIHWPAHEGSWCARPRPHFHQPQGACNLGNHRSGQPDAGNDSLPVSKGQIQRQQLLGLKLPYLSVYPTPPNSYGEVLTLNTSGCWEYLETDSLKR